MFKFIVINHQCSLISRSIGVSKDVFVDIAFRCIKIVKQEVVHLSKQITFFHQRKDFSFVAMDQIPIRMLFPIGAAIFHAVFLCETFYLAMTEHRQAGHGHHHGADTKIFIIFSELFHSRLFIRVIHKIYITFEYFRIKLHGVFNDLAIFLIVFTLQHIHKCTIVNPMHAQRPNKVAFH